MQPAAVGQQGGKAAGGFSEEDLAAFADEGEARFAPWALWVLVGVLHFPPCPCAPAAQQHLGHVLLHPPLSGRLSCACLLPTCPPTRYPLPPDDGWGDDAAAAPTNAHQQQQTEGQWGSGYAGSGYGAPPPAQEQQRFGFGGYGSSAPPAAPQQSGWGGGGGGGGEFNDSAEVLCSSCNGPCHKRTSNTQKNPGRWVLPGVAGGGHWGLLLQVVCRIAAAYSLLRRQLCAHQRALQPTSTLPLKPVDASLQAVLQVPQPGVQLLQVSSCSPERACVGWLHFDCANTATWPALLSAILFTPPPPPFPQVGG